MRNLTWCRSASRVVAIVVLLGGYSARIARAQQNQPSGGDLEILQVKPNFYMSAGAGGNIGVQIGPDGVVVVDAGPASQADRVLAAIQKLSDQPIRYIIDTSADADRVGANETLSKAGRTLLPLSDTVAADLAVTMTSGGVAPILAAENVLRRMSAATGKQSPFPADAWPTETFSTNRKYMNLNNEGIEVLHQPAAHTDGDAMVFFRRSDVVVAGDVFDTRHFPIIDIAKGGSIQGEIAALQKLVDTAIPSVPIVSREAGTLILPGHGRVCDQLDVVEYRDMVTIIGDRIRDLMKQGLTLAQVKAASPARGYTRRYGSDTGSWTTNDFVEAVYRSISEKVK